MVPVGTVISIELTAGSTPPYTWTAVTSDAPATVRGITDHQHLGTTTATFKASTTGTATLSASDNPNCAPCGPPSERWVVTVRVV